MLDLPSLLQQLDTLVERRSGLLRAEAKLWAEAKQVLTEASSTDPKMVQKVAPPSANTIVTDPLLSTKQAAIILHLTTSTLAKWRVYGGGPSFAKLGRRIFYRQSVLESFIATKTYPHTSAYK